MTADMTNGAFSLEQALDIIATALNPIAEPETVPLSQACDRIAAADIAASIAVPRHANAAVDGYGFRFADVPPKQNVRLKVIATAKAGHAYDGDIPPGCAVRIFTGAPVGDAIDTIIMHERTAEDGDGDRIGFASDTIKRGANVRSAGDDVRRGDILIKRGDRLHPAHIGLLAAQATREVSVFRALKVGLLSGGDELGDSTADSSGDTLQDGMIYDSNRPMLWHLLRLKAYEVNDYGIIADDEETLAAVLRQADCDVMLASGGMSLSRTDHLRKILAERGDLHFWQLKCKPGRPAGLGSLAKNDGDMLPIIGLPGNPVAAFTIYCLLGRAVLARLGGENYRPPESFPVRLGEDFRKKPGRREFVRASLKGDNRNRAAFRCGKIGAGVLSSVAQAQGFLDFPENSGDMKAGDMAAFIPMALLLHT